MLSWTSCGGWVLAFPRPPRTRPLLSAKAGFRAGCSPCSQQVCRRCSSLSDRRQRNRLNLQTAMSRLCSRWATGGRLRPGVRTWTPQGQRQHGAQRRVLCVDSVCVCVCAPLCEEQAESATSCIFFVTSSVRRVLLYYPVNLLTFGSNPKYK